MPGNLNQSQLEAVTTTEGYVRVIAGAGSGKTRALTHRFVYLVEELGIAPGNIMCVTFTNKAANEMKKRIHRLIGDRDTAYINTFHGFCVSVLSEESNAVHFPKNFLVLDNSDINSMLDLIYQERGLTSRDMTFSAARDMIEIFKTIQVPEYYRDLIDMSLEALHSKYLSALDVKDIIFYGYLYQQKKCFGLDYNDLIILTLYIFERDPDIRLKWQMRLEYMMIDEFQDIDALQYRLMRVLSQYHKNLFVVGDPDQTIYTWRGANVRYLTDFENQFPGTRTIMMNENYRSTPEIIAAANSLISKNQTRIKKDLQAARRGGREVIYHHGESQMKEAEWIYEQICSLTGIAAGSEDSSISDSALPSGDNCTSVKFGDICILVRAHYLTASLEKVFIDRKLPYRIYSGVQFFERLEIKTAISYLRMLTCRDDMSFVRIVNSPKRNMGKSRMDYLKALAENENDTLYNVLKRHLDDDKFKGTKAADFTALIEEMTSLSGEMSVSELLSKILDISGYEETLRVEGNQERLDNLAELKQLVYEYETTCGEEADLTHFLEHIALYTNTDTPEADDRIKIMTIHAAKGLEFPYVFICGLSEGILPSKKARTIEGLEEERRLGFVAFTRARDGLFLSDAEGMSGYAYRYPSRFVLELDPDVVRYDVPLDPDTLAGAWININYVNRQLMLDENGNFIQEQTVQFKEGMKVTHRVFGKGMVMDYDGDTKICIVKFDSLPTVRNIAADKLEILQQG